MGRMSKRALRLALASSGGVDSEQRVCILFDRQSGSDMTRKTPSVFLTVDPALPEPVYEQIARQIRSRIASGALPAGTLLPPVRTLASDLGYNLNTVARAYRTLEEEGFVRIRERSGAEVAAPPRAPVAGARERLRQELGAVLARLRQAGIEADEIRRIVDRQLASLRGGDGKQG